MAETHPIFSPAALLRSGEIRNIRMMLAFYDAMVDIDPLPSGTKQEVIAFRIGDWNEGVERPSVTFGFSRDTARKAIRELRNNPEMPLKTLPVDQEWGGEVHAHARTGSLRAFVAVFGATGRHLLDAALWALDDEHQPERLDLTHALAKYWQLRTQSSAGVHAWTDALHNLPLDQKIVSEFRRFTPYSE